MKYVAEEDILEVIFPSSNINWSFVRLKPGYHCNAWVSGKGICLLSKSRKAVQTINPRVQEMIEEMAEALKAAWSWQYYEG